MAKTMHEVLAEHGIWGYNGSEVACKCSRRNWISATGYAAHQAAALSAAGYGLVADAKREAPQLKRMRGELKSLGKNLDSWESQGHATVTIRHLRNWVAARAAEMRQGRDAES